MMRNLVKFAVLAGSASLFAGQAMAQDQQTQIQQQHQAAVAKSKGIELRGKRDYFESEMSMRTMMGSPEKYSTAYSLASAVSECVVDKLGADAGRLVGGPMTADENYERLAAALGKDQRACFRADAAGIPMMVVNAALAEQLLRKEPAELEPRAMSLNQDDADGYTTMAPGVKMNFDIIGRCAAVYSPGLTYAVLETKPGSADEAAALGKLYASTPECGLGSAPEGVPASFQRGVLAAGLYHWLHRG